ncbi:DNA polymerase I [bacterium]|nr:DNA polymerase I [bacterium]
MSLILIDGAALFYRAHYAFANRPLTAPNGEVTSVVFGFCNAILRLIEVYGPEKMAVVFDRKGKVFRHDMYPAYKANRKPMPEELAEQLPRLHELLAAWGIAVVEKDYYEADDLMATLARRSEGVVDKVWFYTGDKDFMQLLDDRIGMLKPGRRGDEITPMTVADVKKEFALTPRELIDAFALAGDKADNIPGAPGVGDKTAQKLIREFGSLEDLYAGLEKSKLTPRLKRVLGENRDQVFLSRDLFVIKDDVELDIDWDALDTVLPTGDEARGLLRDLGLRRVLAHVDKLAGDGSGAPVPAGAAAPEGPADPAASSPPAAADADSWAARREARGYVRLADDDSLAAWLSRLDPAAPLAVDTETDGLQQDRCRLVGVCLAGRDAAGAALPPAYIPVLWRDPDPEGAAGGTLFPTGAEHSRLAEVRSLLAPVLAGDAPKIGQNLKFDEWVLGRHDLPLGGPRFDTMLASYVLDPGRPSHGLDDLVAEFLGHAMMPFSGLFAKGDRSQDILGVDPDRLALYAAEDADYTLRLHDALAPRLAEAGLTGLFRDVEMPVAAVLLEMERNGIRLDRGFLGELRERFDAELKGLRERIVAVAGEDFNLNSPKQLQVILFDKLGLKPTKKTSTGWSTDASVLSILAEEHELPQLILDYREVAKLQSTYVETLPQLVHPETGLIHTSYNQAVAATGRLSSSDPNLQNIPIRTELGRQIRRAFVPRDPGNVFLSADYSQVELRLLAHLADDPGLLAAFREGADVHRRTAALIAGVAEGAVDADMRSRAKAINFGVIYGMGARALARQTGVKVAEAGEFIESYFRTYPGVKSFIEETKARAHADKVVTTLLGRRRLLPDIDSSNNRIRSFQERVAVNTPIQGTAADLIKLAMIRISGRLREEGSGALLLLQVHDELVLEVPRGELEATRELVVAGMQGAMSLKVPLVVDVHAGANWAEAHG